MGLISGICITCVLLLLPPMFCFGMVGPMVVALMSSQLETVGKTAGTVYFTSTLGGIAATFFLGLYFIPVAGLRLCATITGLALVRCLLIYILKRVFGGKASRGSVPATAKRSKVSNKKSALKSRPGSAIAAIGIGRTIYLFAVLEGATVMAVELISARMVAPYFGSSLYVWGTVIGFTCLALAIGYFAGGFIADKYSGPDPLLWALLTASVFLMLMHVSSPLLTMAFVNIGPGVAVILVSMALILPPLLFLGMVPTFLIRKISASAESAGSNTGRGLHDFFRQWHRRSAVIWIFHHSAIRIDAALHLHWLAVGLIPFVKLIARKKYMSLLFVPFVLFSFWATKTQQPGKTVDVQILFRRTAGTATGSRCVERSGERLGDRFLFVNRTGQTWVDKETFKPKWDYASYVKSICSKLPEKSNALILGLGGGTVANILQNDLGFNVDAVELDQRIADVAKQYFRVKQQSKRGG